MTFLSPVHLNDVFRVNGKVLVWIYDYTEESRVGLQEEKKAVYSLPDPQSRDCFLRK